MKKLLLLFACFLVIITTKAQDTLTGWTFPVSTGPDSLNANLGTSQNQGYDLRFQLVLTPSSDSTVNTVYFADGPSTFAAATSGWQDGSGVRFWSVKFKAPDYSRFKVSSKQKSVDGPSDFKLQWRLSSTTFEDIPGGLVTVSNDWTTGSVNQLAVPITGQGTGSVYIRWLMNSNTGVNGGTVAPAGISMIDDILVTGVSSLGIDEVVFTNRVSVYPNPNEGSFTVQSTRPLVSLVILDENGRMVYSDNHPSLICKVNLSGISKGSYLLRVLFDDSDKNYTQNFIIR
ncbi:MAG: T9SS type A sorting domain-containing protein [Bacteroidota bacterium]